MGESREVKTSGNGRNDPFSRYERDRERLFWEGLSMEPDYELFDLVKRAKEEKNFDTKAFLIQFLY